MWGHMQYGKKIGKEDWEIWNRAFNKALSKKALFGQRWEWGEGGRRKDIWAKNIPSREHSKCKDSELELCSQGGQHGWRVVSEGTELGEESREETVGGAEARGWRQMLQATEGPWTWTVWGEYRLTSHSVPFMKTILTLVLHRDQLEAIIIMQPRDNDGLMRMMLMEGVRNAQSCTYLEGRDDGIWWQGELKDDPQSCGLGNLEGWPCPLLRWERWLEELVWEGRSGP